jgi:class 3 adenylate cyclase
MAWNAGVREDRRLVFRIGVNIGDIIIDETDIHGDGFYVAARLEELARPGVICISAAASIRSWQAPPRFNPSEISGESQI